MTSREIAELTGKEHRNVVRDIRQMLQELGEGGLLRFEQTYSDPQLSSDLQSGRLFPNPQWGMGQNQQMVLSLRSTNYASATVKVHLWFCPRGVAPVADWPLKMLAMLTCSERFMNQPAAPSRVTTEMVFDAIQAYPTGAFTTFEIAEAMGVPEYPVRAAMSWLLKREMIQKAGARKCYTSRMHEAYWATTYILKPKAAPVDFAALNRAFLFCRPSMA